MNCRITPRPPLRETEPLVGVRSPAMIFSSVVLPEPLGPTRATVEPSPTRKDTSSAMLSATLSTTRSHISPPHPRHALLCPTASSPDPLLRKERTCTCVASAMHMLQRVHRDRNERVR